MRTVKNLIALTIGILVMANAGSALAAGERCGQRKVVYHINFNGGEDSKAYAAAMRNIQNHINAVGAENMGIQGGATATVWDCCATRRATTTCRWR
jgi:hypothetical protein